MRTDYQQILDEINQAIVRAEPHLNVAGAREALAQLRAQADNWRKIDENVGAIRSEIIDPVNDQLATGNKLSLRGYRVGLRSAIVGIAVSVVLFILSAPWETTRDMADIQGDTADIQGRLQRLEAMTRAISQGPSGLATDAAFEPVEGEIEITVNESEPVQSGDKPLRLKLDNVTSDLLSDGTRVLLAVLELYDGDMRQFSNEGLEERVQIDGLFPDRRTAGGMRFLVAAGDTISVMGSEFEVTRVLSREPLERDVSDSTTAVYIRSKQ